MNNEITYAEALNQALKEEMARDKNVVILGEDVGKIGGNFAITKDLYNMFGKERVKDTPISEDAIIGVSLGAALTGLRPVPEIMFSSFLGCAMEEIWNQVSKIRYMSGGQAKAPLVIRKINVLGRSTAAQHSARPEAWFMHMPGIKVVIPATPYDAKGLLKSAIRDDDPVLFFEHALLYYKFKEEIPDDEYLIPIGKAAIKKEGSAITIVTYSLMLHTVLGAARKLAKEGIDVEVIDLRSLVPLDKETILSSVKKTGKLLVVSDDYITCGVGAEIVSLVTENIFESLDDSPVRIAFPDVPVPFSPVLEQYLIPKEENIIQAVHDILRK